MKNLRGIIFLSFAMLPILGHAQRVVYDYDAAGNRIKREVAASLRNATKAEDVQLFKAAPNPVADILQISYEDESGFSGKYQYTLQSIYGETAVTGESTTAGCRLDVSSLPKGVYILNIVYQEERQSIKIIKK